MKYLINLILLVLIIQTSFSQVENFYPCEPLDTNREASLNDIYQDKPCLLDFVRATIKDSTLIKYAGKRLDYRRLNTQFCDESRVVFSEKNTKKQQIQILKDTIFVSKNNLDYDTMTVEGYDFPLIKSVSFQGLPFLGIQFYPLNRGVVKRQTIVSEIKILFNDDVISIPLKKYFLLFNANFCYKNESGLVEPVELYDIGDNKLVVYIHGKPRYINDKHSDYIAKIILDKHTGYIGTIFMHEYDLEAYGWRTLKSINGF